MAGVEIYFKRALDMPSNNSLWACRRLVLVKIEGIEMLFSRNYRELYAL